MSDSDNDITTTSPVKRVIARTIRPGFLAFIVIFSFIFTLIDHGSDAQFFILLGLCIAWSLVFGTLREVYNKIRR